ncbi:Serine/threonine-protein kinase PBS1 [Hibiscus syriacus]|uniref:Serine/threonine-protein kinase PBS1 n=1 Tax=Hibiscus syriacus TaxID=106335 RepID=A0A6A3AYB7_HIBSY|nr:Serine/threonine-protein kinase PBS1 [Hibiscus syriacus]
MRLGKSGNKIIQQRKTDLRNQRFWAKGKSLRFKSHSSLIAIFPKITTPRLVPLSGTKFLLSSPNPCPHLQTSFSTLFGKAHSVTYRRDSSSPYAKHFAFNLARSGWNVVVSNHRGLGGVSPTSNCFYNAGWTEDLRKIIDHIHCEYPEAPLFAVGTSIGANILVN